MVTLRLRAIPKRMRRNADTGARKIYDQLMVVIRATLVVALLSGAASADQLVSPRGELVDVDADHVQSALENGYKRATAEEASRLATAMGPDAPSKFDWSLVLVGGAVAAAVATGAHMLRRKR